MPVHRFVSENNGRNGFVGGGEFEFESDSGVRICCIAWICLNFLRNEITFLKLKGICCLRLVLNMIYCDYMSVAKGKSLSIAC